MKDYGKKAANLFLIILISGVLSVLTYLSINLIFNAFFTDETGYEVYGKPATEDIKSKPKYLYTYEYPEGVYNNSQDEQLKKYQDEGYIINIHKIKNSLNKTEKALLTIISQLFCWFFSFIMLYKHMYNLGNKESSSIVLNRQNLDYLRGAKITLLACIPAFISYIALILSYFLSFNSYMLIYLMLNPAFWPISHLFISKVPTISDLQIYHFVLLLLFQIPIPILGGLSYYLGYKNSFAVVRRNELKEER